MPLSLAVAVCVCSLGVFSAHAQSLDWNLAGSGAWDTSTANWTADGGTTTTTFTSDGTVDVNFDTGSNATVTIAAGMNPASTTASPSGGTLQFSGGPIAGSGGLTKSGDGVLQLNAANSYTGKTVIQAGILQFQASGSTTAILSNAGVNGALGAPTGADAVIDMYNGATLKVLSTINQSTDRTINLADPAGAGTVTIQFNGNDRTFTLGAVTATGNGAKLLDLYTGVNGNGDREVFTINGPVSDVSGDGSPLSLRVAYRTQTNGADSFFNLPGTNTFTGDIELTKGSGALRTGYFTVGGVRTNGGSTPGSGTLGGGSYPGDIAVGAQTVFNYLSSASQTLSGVISGTGTVNIDGGGTVTLAGANTLSGSIDVKSGSSLGLDAAGGLTFYPADNLSSNKVTGAGSATFDGSFTIDTSNVTLTVGTWTLVDTATKSFAPTFSLSGAGWSESSGVWTREDGLRTWTFTEADGRLTLSSEAIFTGFGTAGSISYIDDNAQTILLVVPQGTDFATLAPSFTVSSGVCDQPNGGVPTPTFADTGTVTYTITDGGTVRPYAVTAVESSGILNVNFFQTTPEDTATLTGPAGGAGEIWNQFEGTSGSNLLDSTGGQTGVSFSAAYGGIGTWGTPSLRMLRSGLNHFTKNTTSTTTLSGLAPGAVYDLWIASRQDNSVPGERSYGTWTTPNSTTTVGGQVLDARAGSNESSWEAGNNYVIFENVVVDGGGQIIFTGEAGQPADGTDNRMPLSGFQLVPVSGGPTAGPVDADESLVVAASPTVLADGSSTTSVTATLKDSAGLLIAGEDVTLAGSPLGATISPSATQTTDANGQAVFTVSSTSIGTVVFTATSSTDNVTVTQTASVDFTDPQLAQSFNVNFHAGTPTADLVGLVGAPGETWNQGTTSVTNLTDTTGLVVSSVSVTGLPSSGSSDAATTASLNVFDQNRNFFGKGQDTTLSITGLTPDTPYDLYIFSLSHNVGSWGDISNTERAKGDFVTANTVIGNGQSQWLDNAVPGTNGNAFVPNGNYVAFQSIVADGSGNISIVADAYDGLDGNPATNDGNTRLHICGLQIRPASGMSVDYMNWQSAYYPGVGLPDEDDDGDGLSNDYERIFGLNPASGASASPYSGPFDPATGAFGYTRRSQSLANLNYKVWYSTNLVDWFEDNAARQSVQSVTDGVELMGVEIDPALLSEPKLFVQMRATPITGVDLQPSLLNIRGSGNTITLIYSEPMNPSAASNPANYSVVQDGVGPIAITGATLNAGGGSVTLTLASSLGIDTAYTVSVDGVTSGTGQLLGGATNRAFRTWDDDPAGVKVFILAGQSNMVGRGESERGHGDVDGAEGSLRWEVVTDNANYGQLVVDTGNPATDAWVVRNDVNFWWNRADIGGGPNISKGGLNPQGFGSGPETFGPEYGFGWVVGDAISDPVLVIKTAWGGKDLITNFRPPGAVAARGGVVGPYYVEMIEQVREILHNLGTEFPEWNGLGYRIEGFGWHQGWNDSLNTFAANEYEANMADFITDIRAEFGKPSLPFSIGTTGMIGAATSGDRLTVVNAQINVANPALHPELGGNVFTVDTRPFARTDAQSPTNDSTHWRNNGESMWLIGKGMGDGIVPLLGGP